MRRVGLGLLLLVASLACAGGSGADSPPNPVEGDEDASPDEADDEDGPQKGRKGGKGKGKAGEDGQKGPVAKLPPIDKTPYPDDCTVGSDAAGAPILARKQGDVTVEVYEQPGQTVETVPFSDRPIRVSRGGCHHFGESWSVAVSEGVKPWKAVRKMRQRVTVKRDADIDKCLEALPADEPTDFSLGEITSCGVTIDEGVLTAYFTVAI